MRKMTRTVDVVRERERERAIDQKKLLKFVMQKIMNIIQEKQKKIAQKMKQEEIHYQYALKVYVKTK